MKRGIAENQFDKGAHLTPHLISVFINLKDTLSRTERTFIENHLKKCSECFENFKSIYDEEISIDDRVIFRIIEIDRGYEGKGVKFKDSDFEIIIRQPDETTLAAIPDKLPYAAENQKLKITIEGKEIYWRILNVVEGNNYKLQTKAKNPLSNVSNLLVETVFRSNNELETEIWKKPIFSVAALSIFILLLFLFFFILN